MINRIRIRDRSILFLGVFIFVLCFLFAWLSLVNVPEIGGSKSHNVHHGDNLVGPVQRQESFTNLHGTERHELSPAQKSLNTQERLFGSHVTKSYESSLSFGYEGKHTFHVTAGGTLIEGVIFIRQVPGISFRNKQSGNWTTDDQTGGKTSRFRNGRCYWCPRRTTDSRTGCVYGNFHVGWYDEDDEQSSNFFRKPGQAGILKVRPATNSRVFDLPKEFFTAYFRCDFTSSSERIASGLEGVLRVENLPYVFYVNALPHPSKLEGARKSVICANGGFGSGVSPFAIKQLARHYLHNWKFDALVMHEMGLTRGFVLKDLLEFDEELDNFHKDGRLVFVDNRDSSNRLYGSLSGDIPAFAHFSGQLHAIGDCILRSKVENVEWVFLIDLDEMLGPGSSAASDYLKQGKPETWKEFIARQSTGFFQSTGRELRAIRFERIEPLDEMFCEKCRLPSIMEMVTYIQEKEKDLSKLLQNSGKVAIKLDSTSPFPTINTIGIQTLHEPGFGDRRWSEFTVSTSASDANVRSYKCLQSKGICEDFPLAMSSNDAWAYPVD